ncbi:MAG TPA: Mut7-C RNAse domain-containing protein [bacterium]|jgi:uncharacterized protein with PIN domain|nr:Mut7-C RNAse domain-containing protein [bacterium]HNT65533.1 Mut7-C RNAse domain-containing protein [bacterium]HOX87409.1 Mut7-C RNAse domain-containing protein [bacterium]HPG46870.1 Mut7-C RNAse domain-containing protein [bacterium]HPM99150.1 Mut7-C RNAse domain-containing protein [bacterium]
MNEGADQQARFRFYAELNDFLPLGHRFSEFTYFFTGKPAIKDSIEALGVPHTEVDLILVNQQSVDFAYGLQSGDRVSVYPVFESLNIGCVTCLRPQPLRTSKFILDVHLGKLARRLRLLGFDTCYRNDYTDREIICQAQAEHRIILTRDIGVLKNSAVTHGYWVRSLQANEQLAEVVKRFDLYSQIEPFSRCLVCNGKLEAVGKESILDQVPAQAAIQYTQFSRCAACGHVFWPGTHIKSLQQLVDWIETQDRSPGVRFHQEADKNSVQT